MAFSKPTLKSTHNWKRDGGVSRAPAPTEAEIQSALRSVKDAELNLNIVDLGLIYEARQSKPGHVDILMTLTTPSCPFGNAIVQDVRKALFALPGLNTADLRVTFEPAWSWDRVPEEVRKSMIQGATAHAH
ncbi:MAG: metal-sulfur cluster assembly factor [Acidobacteria bacterium]|nr:metal-sulfur cluster assembly factor [Acidobacteriota bacterium]MBI3489386.1 metal-sulfur cluster assembly factor [Acidobacteriota bacterium]